MYNRDVLAGEFVTIKAEDFDAFYLRAKNGIPGAVRISIKYGRPVNQDVAQDLKYGTSIAETSEVSQTKMLIILF